MRDTAEGKYAGRNNISPEKMRRELPKLEKHTHYYKSSALLTRFMKKMSDNPTATSNPESLAELTRDAEAMMDQALDLAEPERSQIGPLLYQNLLLLHRLAPLADAEDTNEAVVHKLQRSMMSCVARWIGGHRTSEFRAYCTEMIEAITDPENKLTLEDRGKLMPLVERFRAVISEDATS